MGSTFTNTHIHIRTYVYVYIYICIELSHACLAAQGWPRDMPDRHCTRLGRQWEMSLDSGSHATLGSYSHPGLDSLGSLTEPCLIPGPSLWGSSIGSPEAKEDSEALDG